MFSNIGQKIKNLASLCTTLGIIGSCLGGLIIIIGGIDEGVGGLVFIGILVAIAGSLVAWLASFLLYGFGELIDTNMIIASQITHQTNKPSNTPDELVTPKAINYSRYSSEALYLFAYKECQHFSATEKEQMKSTLTKRGFIVDEKLIPFIDGLKGKSKASLELALDTCHKKEAAWISAALNVGFYSDNSY